MSERQHNLLEITRTGNGDCDKVVRWCETCGAVVVDWEMDGRVDPGGYVKMMIPVLTQTTHCRTKGK